MSIAQDIRERVSATADALYAQAERGDFPTVDAVRKAARVNMNDANACMKEWRRAQTVQAAPVAVVVPEAVQQTHGAALAALWQQAQELANESLRAAQASWEVERAEAEALNQQLVDAYETQASELASANARLIDQASAAQQAIETIATLRTELDTARGALVGEQKRSALAEQRAQEIEHRVEDLRGELDRAHQDVAQARALHVSTAAEFEALRGQWLTAQGHATAQTERFDQARAERDEALQAASAAKEQAATLAGSLQAVQTHNAELGKILANLVPPGTPLSTPAEKTSTTAKRKGEAT